MKSNLNILNVLVIVIIAMVVVLTISLLQSQSQSQSQSLAGSVTDIEVLRINPLETELVYPNDAIWYYGNGYGAGGWEDGWNERYYHGIGGYRGGSDGWRPREREHHGARGGLHGARGGLHAGARGGLHAGGRR